ncbi:helix-turn-helix transcriptional regulator [Amycolatopsis sp. lyj-23]|uniref:helix-turn-helix transcriptional regulator n=1 Tax=Amycolatopsis sp. lyj-23 TaxID=2789283 RepID=UPI00397BF361
MPESHKMDAVAAALEALEAAQAERGRLAELGRWTEADEAAVRTLRWVLADAVPAVVGPDVSRLIYVAGRPRPALQEQRRGNSAIVPPERLSAVQGMLLVNHGNDAPAAAELAHRALESFTWRDVDTFWNCILVLLYLDDFEAAQRYCERAMARAGWAASSALTVLRARIAASTGDAATAVRLLVPVVTNGDEDQFTEVGVAWAIEALVDLDELDRADELMRAHALAGSLDAVVDRAEVLGARGLLSRAAGRPESAYEDFVACGRELVGWGVTNPAVNPWRSRAALCAAATGREAVALPLAEEELSSARRWGTARAVGTALRAVGLIRADGDGKTLRNAVQLLTRSRALGTLMESQYELALKLRLEGHHQEVVPVLRALRENALSAHNMAWLARADSAIRRWAANAETAKLTSRERQVANLAQAGFSNGGIADRLQLKISTVEFHLSNVYRKLVIGGRSELRAIRVPIL